ncbi:TonB-dependent receptor [Bacteroides sp.]|uniref:TonB-dependent receptor domain-containing protein n=1 Tax=Bacteroides sp. TaxID=29523 RepID=UPI002606F3C5|nr:TonB-dependent receptor [Bacteroides sp.]MDD3039121.1 TonB-dependent receptor [Bacteroides sp.]
MKSTFILILFIFSFNSIMAITPQIKGVVREKGTGNPIEFADVILLKNGTVTVSHTLTEANGYFQLSGIENGKYSLMVRLIGYDIYTKDSLTLSSSKSTLDFGVIELKPLEIGIAEVVIKGAKRQIVYKLDKKIIDASNTLMSSGGTAVDILENTPSVRVDVDGEVTFRGSSGFKVYIDGKPSFYSGSQALQQIPAGQIENIEIITTPSARYNTDGEAGMINIITKKSQQQGINGIVNTYGSTALSNGIDFLISQQHNKWQWNFAGHWNQPIRESNFEQKKTTIVDNITTTSLSDGPRKGKNYHYGLRGGVEYSFSPRTSVNAELQVYYDKFTRQGDLNYTETHKNGNEESDPFNYNSQDDFDLHSTVNMGKAGFSHKFNDEGHTLTGSFMLGYEGDPLEYFQSDLLDKTGQRQQGHRAWEDEVRWTVQGNITYNYPYSKTGLLESGYQYHSYLEDGDYSMQFWNPEKREFYWREDIYNTFYFQRGIHSVYLMGSDSYKAFDIQAGIRGEHTHQVLNSSIKGANRKVNRFEIFPSVHIGYTLPHEQKLTFAYSYRTNRPELFYMEPYITYRDYYTAEIGNPDIRPEYIHSFELNYKKNLGNQVIQSSLFYRSRKDKIERLRIPYQAGVTLDSMANVGNDHSLGMELSGQLTLNKWWGLNINGNVYYYKVVNNINSGGKKETSTNYDFTVNNLFRVHKNTRIQLDGNFVGPSVTTQGRSSSFWFVNLAIRQQWFNSNLQSTLSFRDIFNSARYKNEITTPTLESITHIRPKFPVITLSISYTFNHFKRNSQSSRDNRDLFEGVNH